MVHSPDPLEDTLKRPITTILPSITTTHHDGGLPSLLSYSSAACRRIGSNTRDGEGWLRVLEEIRRTILWFGWRWPRQSSLRQKDETEMECRPFAACTRDGYVALLPLPPPNSMGLRHQELCSKETKKDKEQKGRDMHKLRCGKWWKDNQGGGQERVCKATQWHQALCHQWSWQRQHEGGWRQWKKHIRQWNCKRQQEDEH